MSAPAFAFADHLQASAALSQAPSHHAFDMQAPTSHDYGSSMAMPDAHAHAHVPDTMYSAPDHTSLISTTGGNFSFGSDLFGGAGAAAPDPGFSYGGNMPIAAPLPAPGAAGAGVPDMSFAYGDGDPAFSYGGGDSSFVYGW
jgi:hypothetical protein